MLNGYLNEDCLDSEYYEVCKDAEDVCECVQAYENEDAIYGMFPNDEDGEEFQEYLWKDM